MDAQLQKLASLPQKERTQAYIGTIDDTFKKSTNLVSDVAALLDHVLQPDFAQIVAQQALAELVAHIKLVSDHDTRKQLLKDALDRTHTRATQYEEQISALREQYADMLEQDEEYEQAARTLIGIPLDSRSVEDKLRIYIRIVRLYLEEENSTAAETYFNRASLISHQTKDAELQLHYKLSQARMFDYNRKFVEAASKYHDISYNQMIGDDERMHTLNVAIQCAILAPAGPHRSRVLSSLYRDERAASTPHFNILSKMFLDQMIRPDEVKDFASSLRRHQLAKLATPIAIKLAPDAELEQGKTGPETVLDRAVMEHNVLSASKVYNNITFKGLGALLDLKPSAAESMARTMNQQGRLKATIDQIEQLIVFEVDARENDGVVSNVAQKMMAAAGTAINADGVGGGSNGEDGANATGQDEQATAPATVKFDLHVRRTLQLTETIAARCEALLAKGTNGAAATVPA
ncbi:hypothetical protein OIV83_003092 [Microbotryomycetes sp. JL201]|nr:hypothetical protein OIV83_003092 [Microbotryomycetes sp. JL201]